MFQREKVEVQLPELFHKIGEQWRICGFEVFLRYSRVSDMKWVYILSKKTSLVHKGASCLLINNMQMQYFYDTKSVYMQAHNTSAHVNRAHPSVFCVNVRSQQFALHWLTNRRMLKSLLTSFFLQTKEGFLLTSHNFVFRCGGHDMVTTGLWDHLGEIWRQGASLLSGLSEGRHHTCFHFLSLLHSDHHL